jgi:hypothetical protein
VQIALLDIVFSLDSVITAVGMANQVAVMIIAIMLAVGFMMFTAGPVSTFVERHPTVKMLALSFLLLIGVTLIAEGFGHVANPPQEKPGGECVSVSAKWQDTWDSATRAVYVEPSGQVSLNGTHLMGPAVYDWLADSCVHGPWRTDLRRLGTSRYGSYAQRWQRPERSDPGQVLYDGGIRRLSYLGRG